MSTNPSRGGPGATAALISAGIAALGVLLAWGFVVDDAWITARVAWRLANGLGYRFNAQGPRVDAVTPLGWVFLLVPFAKHSVSNALLAARIIGAVSWIAAAGWFGYRLRTDGKNPYFAAPLLAVAPLGAWAGSGMETGLVLALATVALGDSIGAAFALGLVAAWRPELVPFCIVLSLRPFVSRQPALFRRLLPLALSLGLPLAVAIVRQVAFGRPMPLAVLAKPSDLVHGVQYGMGFLLFLGPTWLWLGGGWKSLTRGEQIMALGVAVHLVALVVAGGDWMPLWRLAVPVIPAALWAASCLHSYQRRVYIALRLGTGVVVAACVWFWIGIPGRHVMRARAQLIEQGRVSFAGANYVATLDVGWVGAAFSGEILDLAGVTDPRVALLAGGHTTKKIQNSWFDSVQPDTLVLLTAPGQPVLSPWTESCFSRAVENRVATMPYWQSCSKVHELELMFTTQTYAVIRCP